MTTRTAERAGTYNGWRNYSTWVVKLWMDNDQAEQEYWAMRAASIQADTRYNWPDDGRSLSPDRARVHKLAEILEQAHDESAPPVPGVYGDLLTHALGLVDWVEIAESLLSE